MAATVAQLIDILTLERIEDDIFRGRSPETTRQRVFGGQVLGQALMAVGRTAPAERSVHSLHAYFLRPGDPAVPIVYVVERVRDGGSFSTRRVLAQQHGRPIFQMSASFQIAEDGFDHQEPIPPVVGPDGPGSSTEPPGVDAIRWADRLTEWAAIDVRFVPTVVDAGRRAGADDNRLHVWLRAAEELPDDPLLHAAVLAYASDMTLLSAAMVPHAQRLDDPRMQSASLDHAMWFHRPFRADDWLLHDQWSPSASNARGLGQGSIFTADGRLVVSAVQEGLTRWRPAIAPR